MQKHKIKINCIFSSKLNIINIYTVIIFIVYSLSVTIIPVTTTILTINHNNLYKKNNNAFFKLPIKSNLITGDKIDILSYINDKQMLDRQIDNDSLQSYIHDVKGSVLKLNDISNAANNETYFYDAYGNTMLNSSLLQTNIYSQKNFLLTFANSFQYNGERFDQNTNLQYLRARFYDLKIKRFINQDSYALLNRFYYGNANPIINIDPTGHVIESLYIKKSSSTYLLERPKFLQNRLRRSKSYNDLLIMYNLSENSNHNSQERNTLLFGYEEEGFCKVSNHTNYIPHCDSLSKEVYKRALDLKELWIINFSEKISIDFYSKIKDKSITFTGDAINQYFQQQPDLLRLPKILNVSGKFPREIMRDDTEFDDFCYALTTKENMNSISVRSDNIGPNKIITAVSIIDTYRNELRSRNTNRKFGNLRDRLLSKFLY